MLDPETKQRPEDQRHRAEPEDLRRSPGIPGATPSEQQHERRCCQNHEASARHIEPMLAKPGGKPFQRLVHHRKRQRGQRQIDPENPRRKPHAFLITSEEIHMINFVTPGGFVGALTQMSAPAERMEVPRHVHTVTYANADLTETVKVLEQYGVRLLTAEEIHAEMPEYPSGCSLLR